MSNINILSTTKSALAALMAALTILATASGCGETSVSVVPDDNKIASAVSKLIEADNSSLDFGTAAVPSVETSADTEKVSSAPSKGDTSDEISEDATEEQSIEAAQSSVPIQEQTTEASSSVSSKGDAHTEEQSSIGESPSLPDLPEETSNNEYSNEETEEIVEYSTESAAETTEPVQESSEMIEEKVETIHLSDEDFMTMHQFGASGDIHKDALLEVNLEYKGITIPKGTVMHIWSAYGDSEYVARWYDYLVVLPQVALAKTESPLRNIYRTIGIDEGSIMDIHSDPSIALPTKQLVMLEDRDLYILDKDGNEISSLALHKGGEITVFDFHESDIGYIFRSNGVIWRLVHPNVAFISEQTFGLYTPSYGTPSRWVRVLEEHWYQFEDFEPFEQVYTVQWGGGNQMIDGKLISSITKEPEFPVFPVIEYDETLEKKINKYARIQGMFDVDFPANPGFYKTVPAGTVVYVEGKTVDGEYLITWYDHLIKIPHYMLKFDASIIERDGYLFNKSGSLREPLMSAGLYYKPGIIGGADYLYCKDP